MEALGVAASIIAVVQIATEVGKVAVKYGEAVKNAKKDIEEIDGQLQDLRAILTKLKGVADRAVKSGEPLEKWPTLVSLNSDGGALVQCRTALIALQMELALVDGSSKYKERVLWPRKKKKVETGLDNIKKQKMIFLESLNIEHM